MLYRNYVWCDVGNYRQQVKLIENSFKVSLIDINSYNIQ